MSATCTSWFFRHFGTDLKLAGWLIFSATLLYLSVLGYYFSHVLSVNPVGAYFTLSSVYILLLGAISYLVGSIIFLSLSFNFSKIRVAIKNTKIENLGVLRKYFHGNPLLIVSWMFFFPTIIYVIIPILAYNSKYITVGEFIGSLIGLSFVAAVTFLWVYSCFPENLLKNRAEGSSLFYDSVCCPTQWSGEYLKTQWGSDFIVAMRIIRSLAITLMVFSLISAIFDPRSLTLWLFFTASVLFTSGVSSLAAAAYSADLDSTNFSDFLQGKISSSVEETPLLPVA